MVVADTYYRAHEPVPPGVHMYYRKPEFLSLLKYLYCLLITVGLGSNVFLHV